ncbi:Medium-chain fatty acid ethyl ester synthase/esterase [Seminavis robusta]|uniref:Medium-chain fatty acid ethyl ester synthase/esterase n=1 Tax=Seminavis robusta TaxID=568900 RepID=A0A9N8H7A3_9STRA|nr:Medium-chain fatty acid ethyl ester synthase/esterase [Seminavis robusta]|eukprot:Sro135_g063760.1 Medium-chain fatty acid ethyl ester synthase/esterase (650) ;mRNA; r:46678-48756
MDAMGAEEVLPGATTPVKANGCRKSRDFDPGVPVEDECDDGDHDDDKAIDPQDGEEPDDDEDDESFVTMQEMKGSEHNGDDAEVFANKLGYEDMTTANKRVNDNNSNHKRPSKVILQMVQDYINNNSNEEHCDSNQKVAHRTSSFRRMSQHLSRELVRQQSSIVEALPETPAGWTVLVSALASAVLGYELHLQQSLSCPPWVFGQCTATDKTNTDHNSNQQTPLQPIFDRLTATPNAILSRPIKPSLFVGTRGTMASAAGYALWGPPSTDRHLAFKQVLTMSADGANILLDWELPPLIPTDKQNNHITDQERIEHVKTKGAIQQPVILILTGMNNDTSFGYVKSLQRTFTDRGWIAVAMNFRGVGGIKLATPRCYNGGYTGDLRGVVQYLASRLAPSVPLFLVGNSLSANIVTKYLGEEGQSGTLPACVAGGAALGNPLLMHVNNLHTPWKEVLALGVKKDLILNWPVLRHMTVPSFREAIYNTLKARTIGDVDEALAPIFIRNEAYYPFAVRIGFRDAEHYWADSSSFKYIKHISVPCLQLVAGDDMIVYKSFQKTMTHCIQNPYVMCVETKCGGHLGWQESPPDSNAFGVGTSWADRATADFFEAILKTGTFDYRIASETPRSEADTAKHSSVAPQTVDLPRFRSKL